MPVIRPASDARIGCVSDRRRMVAELQKVHVRRAFVLWITRGSNASRRRLLLRPRGADRCEFRCSHADARREIGDLAARHFGRWPVASRIVVVTREPSVIDSEKPSPAEAVACLAHIGGPVENVVARIEHVGAEMVTGAQFG